jgi:mRNA-degrading endonuclease RelE of RelBE toxin-antitoxin system
MIAVRGPLVVRFLRSAAKDLEGLPVKDAEAILSRIERYAQGEPADVKRLKGRGEIRLRVGDYRVLLVKTGVNVDIHRVLHRREAYR